MLFSLLGLLLVVAPFVYAQTPVEATGTVLFNFTFDQCTDASANPRYQDPLDFVIYPPESAVVACNPNMSVGADSGSVAFTQLNVTAGEYALDVTSMYDNLRPNGEELEIVYYVSALDLGRTNMSTTDTFVRYLLGERFVDPPTSIVSLGVWGVDWYRVSSRFTVPTDIRELIVEIVVQHLGPVTGSIYIDDIPLRYTTYIVTDVTEEPVEATGTVLYNFQFDQCTDAFAEPRSQGLELITSTDNVVACSPNMSIGADSGSAAFTQINVSEGVYDAYVPFIYHNWRSTGEELEVVYYFSEVDLVRTYPSELTTFVRYYVGATWDNEVFPPTTRTNLGNWTRVSSRFTIPASNDAKDLYVDCLVQQSGPVTGSIYFDDISIRYTTYVVGNVHGDPQFVGLRGQNYQVHGIDGAVYNLVSSTTTQVNSRFVFLEQGQCPVFDGISARNCWSHSGSYLGAIGVQQVVNGVNYKLEIVAGSAKQGFALIQLDGVSLSIGADFKHTDVFRVQYVSSHIITVDTTEFVFTFDNSDMFINQHVEVRKPVSQLTSHGLFGQLIVLFSIQPA